MNEDLELKKRIIKSVLLNNEKKWIYFFTITFPLDSRKLLLKEKLNEMKKLIKNLKRKKEKDFEYFWIKEGTRLNIHFHLLTNWKYSYNYITNYWNNQLKIKEKVSSTYGRFIDNKKDINKLYDYLLKEKITYFQFSKEMMNELKDKYKLEREKSLELNMEKYKSQLINLRSELFSYETLNKKIKELNNKFLDQTVILNLNKTNYKKVIQMLLELNMVTNYEMLLKEDKNIRLFITFYLKKYQNQIKESWVLMEKTILKERNYTNNVLYKYINDLKKDESNFIVLWKNILIFFYFSEKFQKHFLNLELINNIADVMINWLPNEYKKEYLSDDLLKLGLNFKLYLESVFSSILKIHMESNKLEGLYFKLSLNNIVDVYDLNLVPNLKFKKLPMLVKPKNWKKNQLGGYLSNGLFFNEMLVKENRNNILKIKNNKIYNYINKLQNNKVKINNKILNYIIDNFDWLTIKLFDKKSLSELKLEYERKVDIYNKLKHTKNVEDLLINNSKLNQKILDYEKYLENIKEAYFYSQFSYFYYTYSLDFRGRCYLNQTTLNYQQDKMVRGLICSYEESEFDFYWFKISFMRLKGSVERTKENLLNEFDKIAEEIYNFKENPKIWLESENPWITLSYCLEYYDFCNFKKDNPTKRFMTSLYIEFDCTCSAYQLLSCLIGNSKYVNSLNLIKKGDLGLGDIYMEFTYDFKNFIKDKNKIYYKKLESLLYNDKLWRRLLKKIWMTKGYGLKSYGIKTKLFEANFKHNLGLNRELIEFIGLNIVEFMQKSTWFNFMDILVFFIEKNKNFDREINLFLNENGYIKNKSNADLEIELYYNKLKLNIMKVDKIMGFKPGEKKRYQREVTSKTKLPNIDKNKTIDSLKANIFHALDSVWLRNSCELLFENKLNYLVIHDCILITHKNINLGLNCMLNGLFILFEDDNQLYNLLYSLSLDKDNNNLSVEEDLYIRNLVKNLKGDFKLNKDIGLDYFVFP